MNSSLSTRQVILLCFTCAVILAAGKARSLYQNVAPEKIDFWQISNEKNASKVDHQIWQKILNEYLVTDKNTGFSAFSYAAVNKQNKQQLKEYITQLEAIDPRALNKNEQFAYWVNLYNASAINLVLSHYPIESIKDIGNTLTGPWNDQVATVAGQPITLNKIEHKILRPNWQDNRVHYVINCASFSCPDLPAQALTSDNLATELNQAAKRFINQTKAVNFTKNGNLILSSIYTWFLVDFGDSHKNLLNHLRKYSTPAQQNKLQQFKGDIDFQYNWKLNAPEHGQVP